MEVSERTTEYFPFGSDLAPKIIKLPKTTEEIKEAERFLRITKLVNEKNKIEKPHEYLELDEKVRLKHRVELLDQIPPSDKENPSNIPLEDKEGNFYCSVCSLVKITGLWKDHLFSIAHLLNTSRSYKRSRFKIVESKVIPKEEVKRKLSKSEVKKIKIEKERLEKREDKRIRLLLNPDFDLKYIDYLL